MKDKSLAHLIIQPKNTSVYSLRKHSRISFSIRFILEKLIIRILEKVKKMSAENPRNLIVEEAQTKSTQVEFEENQNKIRCDQQKAEVETLEIEKIIVEQEGQGNQEVEGQQNTSGKPRETVEVSTAQEPQDDETLQQMKEEILQKRERRSKKRNDGKNTKKDQRSTRKKVEEAKSGEENSVIIYHKNL